VAKIFNLPLNIRFGRQNLMYGSGFVLFDGQSQFASTSIFLDGIKLSWNISDNAVLEGFYFKDEENNRDNQSGDDITLSGIYFTSKYPALGKKQEVYILHRNDQKSDKNIFLYGARLSDKFKFGLDYSAEGGLQKGDFTKTFKQNAAGCKLELGYSFKNIFAKPRFFMGYVSLSGDEAGSTDTNEAWDVFYGGWPQYGDLLAWKYVNIGTVNNITNYDPNYNIGSSTGGEVVYSNFNIATVGVNTILCDKFSTKFSISKITVDKTYDNADDEFGYYYQLFAMYDYSKQLSFSLYAAMIDPGHAFGDKTDRATEIFWEANLKF